ncbi:MAG: 50S ribosome-binding GTPase [Solirubrobacterales bacterium]|nr:50S ribosome-binding GTPase [Solirubrobacterales bacterium]
MVDEPVRRGGVGGGRVTSNRGPRERAERAISDGRKKLAQGARDVSSVATSSAEEVAKQLVRARIAGGKAVAKHGSRKTRRESAKYAADPAAYFNGDYERHVQQLGLANILISGQTGVGKSTLINAVFRARLAAEGIGKPVTKHVQRYQLEGVPVTIYDTPGIELGQSKKEVIREYKKTIKDSLTRPLDEHVHIAWYCMSAETSRVQDYDVDVIKALAEQVPVLLVLTQCVDDERAEALETAIAADNLPIRGAPLRTLARERTVAGHTIPPKGLEELVERTHEILPEGVRRAFTNAQGVVIRLKVRHARAVVGAAGAAAGTVGAVPIPISDAVVLMPIQVGMLAGITAIFGVDVTRGRIAELIRGLAKTGGTEWAGKALVQSLLKAVPGTELINAAVATAITLALGEAHIQLCKELLHRQSSGGPMTDAAMLSFLLNAYQRAWRAGRG